MVHGRDNEGVKSMIFSHPMPLWPVILMRTDQWIMAGMGGGSKSHYNCGICAIVLVFLTSEALVPLKCRNQVQTTLRITFKVPKKENIYLVAPIDGPYLKQVYSMKRPDPIDHTDNYSNKNWLI